MDYRACLEKKESEDFLEYRDHLAFLDLQVKETVLNVLVLVASFLIHMSGIIILVPG